MKIRVRSHLGTIIPAGHFMAVRSAILTGRFPRRFGSNINTVRCPVFLRVAKSETLSFALQSQYTER